jgi:hypothetical protein
MKPLAIDLYCGLGGWTEGLLAEGYDVIGFDIERHDYGTGGYPAQLVLQDVLTLHGAQFRDADLIVASPPCQAYSYRAMPWSRAKALPPPDNALFDACFRIQREASAAAVRYIPMVVENVRGAQKWVGRSRWNYGSFHLWGDVPALMPMTAPRQVMKQGIAHCPNGETNFHRHISEGWRAKHYERTDKMALTNQAEHEGVKFSQSGAAWFDGTPRDKMLCDKGPAAFSSKSSARKAASAIIAKVPMPLARYIGAVWYPRVVERAA